MPRPILPEVMKARAGVPTSDLLARLWVKKLQGYSITTITGVPPIRFRSDGSPLTAWTIAGNGQQTGTPSPDNIIIPDFCGKLVGTDWTIPITSAGQTVPVYLGEVPTVRRIKKLVLTGQEEVIYDSTYTRFTIILPGCLIVAVRRTPAFCTHYEVIDDGRSISDVPNNSMYSHNADRRLYIKATDYSTNDAFKAYLAAQYAAGTPVTVWYVLDTPTTGIVNEPLCKIGDYADELHSADAGVTIQTTRGSNTLTVDTDLQPSSMSITGHIKQA